MAVLSRGEGWVLAAASAVLVAALVSAPLLDDHAGSSPSQAGRTPAPSPTPAALVVSGLRITTYSRGSHELVVRLLVSTGDAASVRADGRDLALHLQGGEVSGRLPVDCSRPAPQLVLVVVAGGQQLTMPLGRPTAAFAAACGSPRPTRPTGPVPSSTPVGS